MKFFSYKKMCTLFLLLALCVLGVRGYGQTPPARQWDRTFGTNIADYLPHVTRLNDGNILVAVCVLDNAASGNKTMPGFGTTGGDIWMIKLDPSGNTLWQKQYGTTAADYPMAIEAEKDGGFYILAETGSAVDNTRTAPSKGAIDYWLIKCDADGNKLWDKTYGGTNNDRPYTGKATADGGFIIGGHSTSRITGDKTEDKIGPTNTDSDLWIVKVDKDGNKLWDRTIGTTGSGALEEPRRFLEVSDGYVVFASYTIGTGGGNITTTSKGQTDIWIGKLDKTTGAIIWQQGLGTNVQDTHVYGPAVTPDGGFLVPIRTASIVANGDKSLENATPSYLSSTSYDDYWIVKLDANGNKVWDKTYGGSDDDWPAGVISHADGTATLYGSTQSPKSGLVTVAPYGVVIAGGTVGDLWIVKIDADGNIIWQRIFGSTASEQALYDNRSKYTDAVLMPDNSYVFATITDSYTSVNNDFDRTVKPYGTYDLWVIKTQPPQEADLAVTVSPVTSTGNQGESLSYTVTVTNNGPNTAPNAMVEVPIPTGYTFLSAMPSAGSYSYGTKVWTVGSLANGASATLVVSIKVN